MLGGKIEKAGRHGSPAFDFGRHVNKNQSFRWLPKANLEPSYFWMHKATKPHKAARPLERPAFVQPLEAACDACRIVAGSWTFLASHLTRTNPHCRVKSESIL